MRWNAIQKTMVMIMVLVFSLSSPALPSDAVYRIKVNEAYGKVQQRFKGSAEKTIIHIQDAHASSEAQENIAHLIAGMVADNKQTVVGVEGASGSVNVEKFREFPVTEAREAVARQFMKKGLFTGSEYLAVSSEEPVSLYGLESSPVFERNLATFAQVMNKRDDIFDSLAEIENALQDLKGVVYEPKLLEFDAVLSAYEKGAADMQTVLPSVYEQMSQLDLDPVEYVQLNQCREVFGLAQQFSTDAARKELQGLVAILKDTGIEKDLCSVSEYEQCVFVRSQCLAHAIDLTPYRQFTLFCDYQSKYARIDMVQLVNEVSKAGYTIRMKRAETADSKTLVNVWHMTQIVKHALSLTAQRSEAAFFCAHQDTCSIQFLTKTIRSVAGRYGKEYSFTGDAAVMDAVNALAVQFYQDAAARDDALVDNLVAQMEVQKSNTGILLSGGFHSNGVVRKLREKGFNYMTVLPTITSAVEDVPYAQKMTGQLTALSQMSMSFIQLLLTSEGVNGVTVEDLQNVFGINAELATSVLMAFRGLDVNAVKGVLADVSLVQWMADIFRKTSSSGAAGLSAELQQTARDIIQDYGRTKDGLGEYLALKRTQKSPVVIKNGRPSHLAAISTELYEYVRSSEFIAAHGNWQKGQGATDLLLDAYGEPQLVYHGSQEYITEFTVQQGKTGADRDNAAARNEGTIYFASDPYTAASYGPQVTAAFLSIGKKNMFAGKANEGTDWRLLARADLVSIKNKEFNRDLVSAEFDGIVAMERNGEHHRTAPGGFDVVYGVFDGKSVCNLPEGLIKEVGKQFESDVMSALSDESRESVVSDATAVQVRMLADRINAIAAAVNVSVVKAGVLIDEIEGACSDGRYNEFEALRDIVSRLKDDCRNETLQDAVRAKIDILMTMFRLGAQDEFWQDAIFPLLTYFEVLFVRDTITPFDLQRVDAAMKNALAMNTMHENTATRRAEVCADIYDVIVDLFSATPLNETAMIAEALAGHARFAGIRAEDVTFLGEGAEARVYKIVLREDGRPQAYVVKLPSLYLNSPRKWRRVLRDYRLVKYGDRDAGVTALATDQYVPFDVVEGVQLPTSLYAAVDKSGGFENAVIVQKFVGDEATLKTRAETIAAMEEGNDKRAQAIALANSVKAFMRGVYATDFKIVDYSLDALVFDENGTILLRDIPTVGIPSKVRTNLRQAIEAYLYPNVAFGDYYRTIEPPGFASVVDDYQDAGDGGVAADAVHDSFIVYVNDRMFSGIAEAKMLPADMQQIILDLDAFSRDECVRHIARVTGLSPRNVLIRHLEDITNAHDLKTLRNQVLILDLADPADVTQTRRAYVAQGYAENEVVLWQTPSLVDDRHLPPVSYMFDQAYGKDIPPLFEAFTLARLLEMLAPDQQKKFDAIVGKLRKMVQFSTAA